MAPIPSTKGVAMGVEQTEHKSWYQRGIGRGKGSSSRRYCGGPAGPTCSSLIPDVNLTYGRLPPDLVAATRFVWWLSTESTTKTSARSGAVYCTGSAYVTDIPGRLMGTIRYVYTGFGLGPMYSWIIIDAKIYDLSRFANLHPGGRAVLVDSPVAGQNAIETFYDLHRHEVLERSQYARLQIVLRGEQCVITGRLVGGLSSVPFAESTYPSKGFYSPYYTEVRVCMPAYALARGFCNHTTEYRGAEELALAALLAGMVIGLPPVLNSGLHETSAVKSEGCIFRIINGGKKWITNGQYVLIPQRHAMQDNDSPRAVELSNPDHQVGLITEPIITFYTPTAGAAVVTFDTVAVVRA
ncbi:hypothetical protein DFH94DRAFT_688483 [Russula ochroleuca]|uniref:Cytochrome b5 heme-binding domain-containing protein n=1 Tax=Russula ochroleuca TaxID=152965 RepID=A0A9P5N4P0_9AGAM|nr:hypothetical protein DFH94DRAFT_688483 [Russula ochroleuca]